jgi:hypothetical protein
MKTSTQWIVMALASGAVVLLVLLAVSNLGAPASSSTGGNGEGLWSVFWILPGTCLYFLPAFVGHHKRSATAIFALDLLLGWTIIGWIAALVWALTPDPQPVVVYHRREAKEK